jgi:protein subunit release factor B
LKERSTAKPKAGQRVGSKRAVDAMWAGLTRRPPCDRLATIKRSCKGVEISNTQKVLDGDLDEFIPACLKRDV